jgi:hypothetical protein
MSAEGKPVLTDAPWSIDHGGENTGRFSAAEHRGWGVAGGAEAKGLTGPTIDPSRYSSTASTRGAGSPVHAADFGMKQLAQS